MVRPRTTLLLMTATVHPHAGVGNLLVTDPQERMRQYVDSLRFALSLPRSAVNGIVLAENSGADLSPLQEVVGDREDVELMTVDPTDLESNPGRGWLETQLVATAMHRSQLVAAGSDPLVWKTTGRYQVRNLASLIQSADAGADLYFNLRRRPEEWADMWVYGTTPAGMALLVAEMERIREEHGPSERAMFRILQDLRARGADVSLRFGVEPRIDGVRGHDGRSYSAPSQRAKWVLRSVGRRVAPALWI